MMKLSRIRFVCFSGPLMAAVGLLAPFFASAATLYVAVPTSSVPVGASVPITVLLDTDQPVNAYAIHVGYSGAGLQFANANNANSLITVWQNTPIVSGSSISFDGGSLRPFEGTGGELMTLNFTAVATGTFQFDLGGSFVYLANGKGTKVVPDVRGAAVTVVPPAPGVPAASGRAVAVDTMPPVVSYLDIIPDPFNTGQKLLGFSVNDSGSGIKDVEICYRSGFLWSGWQTISNPAPLSNGVWEVKFRVFDNAGNVTERTVYDWWAFDRLLLVCLVVVLAVIAIIKVLK